jgi:hypothetical protein
MTSWLQLAEGFNQPPAKLLTPPSLPKMLQVMGLQIRSCNKVLKNWLVLVYRKHPGQLTKASPAGCIASELINNCIPELMLKVV